MVKTLNENKYKRNNKENILPENENRNRIVI